MSQQWRSHTGSEEYKEGEYVCMKGEIFARSTLERNIKQKDYNPGMVDGQDSWGI